MQHNATVGLPSRQLQFDNGFSFFLNFSRFFAALVVFFMHGLSAGPVLNVLAPLRIEHDAVIVFFVLSGYLVAYAAENRETTLPRFIKSRTARILSVSIPALILTVGYEVGGRLIWPGWIYGPSSQIVPWLFGSTFFLNEVWYWDIRIPSEAPYWSLAYEVWFYAIFAAWFFGRGAKRVVGSALVSLIAGPKILLLMPVWLLGVAVFYIHKHWPRPRIGSFAAPASLGAVAAYIIWKTTIGREPYFDSIGWFGQTLSTVIWSHIGLDISPSGLIFYDLIVGIFYGILLLSIKFVSFPAIRKGFAFNFVKWGAGISFSLYLYQIPLFNIVTRILVRTVAPVFVVPGNFVITFLVVILLALVTEHQKPAVERLIGAVMGHMRDRRVANTAIVELSHN